MNGNEIRKVTFGRKKEIVNPERAPILYKPLMYSQPGWGGVGWVEGGTINK